MKNIMQKLSSLVAGLMVALSSLSLFANEEIAWVTDASGKKVIKCIVECDDYAGGGNPVGTIVALHNPKTGEDEDEIDWTDGMTITFPQRTENGTTIRGFWWGWRGDYEIVARHIIIPEGYEEVGPMLFTEISEKLFGSSNLEIVRGYMNTNDACVLTLPSTVRELGFDGNYTKIEVSPDNPWFKVIDWNFYWCENGDGVPTHLKCWIGHRASKVTIPATVREFSCGGMIGHNEPIEWGWGPNDRLKEIVVEDGNDWFKVENGLLLSKDGLILYAVPPALRNVTIPDSVEVIGGVGFIMSSVENLIVPTNVTVIGRSFFGTDMKSLKLQCETLHFDEKIYGLCEDAGILFGMDWFNSVTVELPVNLLDCTTRSIGFFDGGGGCGYKLKLIGKPDDVRKNIFKCLMTNESLKYGDEVLKLEFYVDAADKSEWTVRLKRDYYEIVKEFNNVKRTVKYTVKAANGSGGGSSKPDKPVALPKVNWTYDGYVLDGDTVAGLVTLTVTGTEAKPKLTAKVTTTGGNLALKGTIWEEADGACWVTMAAKGKTMTLVIGDGVASGTLDGMEVCLARNQAADKAGQSAVAPFVGNYTAALKGDNVAGYLQLTVKAAKGSVIVKGAMSDGSAISEKTTLCVSDDDVACIPVFVTKKGKYTLSALLRIAKDGSVESDPASIPHWDASGLSAELSIGGARFSPASVEGEKVLTFDGLPGLYDKKLGDYVPAVGEASPNKLPVTVTKGRIAVPKATKPKKGAEGYEYNWPTDAGVKLTYTPSSGMLKGSLKFYYDWEGNGKWQHKAVTAKLQGVAVGDRFVGFATVPQSNPSLKKTQKTVTVPFVIE